MLAAVVSVLWLTEAVALESGPTAMPHLSVGTWRVESPLGELSGPYLLLDDGDAAWRLELARDGRGQEPLLRRHGEGWTLCGDGHLAFIQTWSSPWNQVGEGTACFLGELAARLPRSSTPGSRPRSDRVILPSWDELPAGWRPPSRLLAHRGQLRRELVLRGLGAGGDGLVVEVRADGATLILTSSRWPVTVTLIPSGGVPGLPEGWIPPPESFLPLWPLADILP